MITQLMLKDALRYMGTPYEMAESDLVTKVEEAFMELEKISTKRFVYGELNIEIIGDEDKVRLRETCLEIQSKDLTKLLASCDKVYIMAVTLGAQVDRTIGIKQRQSMLEAMALDAAASVLVESVCDEAEQEIIEKLDSNSFLTMRFSPGYGDVPLEISKAILDILQAGKRIGLTLSDSHLLLPTKSITALVGVSGTKQKREKSCGSCNLVRTCLYRKRGQSCGL